MYAVGALVILFPAIMVTFDEDEIWQRVRWADGEAPPPVSAGVSGAEEHKMRLFTTETRSSRRSERFLIKNSYSAPSGPLR